MKQPLINGRKAPRNDWEGDDFTPGAGGRYVTCQDTATGRMVAYATNGRVDRDGRVYRHAIPYDPDGVTLGQMAVATKKVAKLPLIIPTGWEWKDVHKHLVAYKGLIIDGWYEAFPRAYRYQPSAAFAHAIFVSHHSKTSGLRVWNALNPDTTAYGRWMPETIVREFAETLAKMNNTHLFVGFVPLQPIIL